MKSNGVADGGGGNREDFDKSLLIPLRRDDDGDGIGGGSGMEDALIGNNEDKSGEDATEFGPNGGKKSVFACIKRFRSSFRENDGI